MPNTLTPAELAEIERLERQLVEVRFAETLRGCSRQRNRARRNWAEANAEIKRLKRELDAYRQALEAWAKWVVAVNQFRFVEAGTAWIEQELVDRAVRLTKDAGINWPE